MVNLNQVYERQYTLTHKMASSTVIRILPSDDEFETSQPMQMASQESFEEKMNYLYLRMIELLTILVIVYLYCTDSSVGEHITTICFVHYFFRLLIKVNMFVD